MSPSHLFRPSRPVDGTSAAPERNTLRDGDILLTYGTAGIWPPRRWFLGVVYHAIRKFQQRRWGQGADTGPTHVRVWLHGRFFEATTPRCQWTALEDLHLTRKRWKLVRYHAALNSVAMLQCAYRLVHTPYDKGDLLDFALSGWLGRSQNLISLFGDRANKFRVCSTAAAEVLSAGGAQFHLPVSQIDPAYFANVTSDWRLIRSSNHPL